MRAGTTAGGKRGTAPQQYTPQQWDDYMRRHGQGTVRTNTERHFRSQYRHPHSLAARPPARRSDPILAPRAKGLGMGESGRSKRFSQPDDVEQPTRHRHVRARSSNFTKRWVAPRTERAAVSEEHHMEDEAEKEDPEAVDEDDANAQEAYAAYEQGDFQQQGAGGEDEEDQQEGAEEEDEQDQEEGAEEGDEQDQQEGAEEENEQDQEEGGDEEDDEEESRDEEDASCMVEEDEGSDARRAARSATDKRMSEEFPRHRRRGGQKNRARRAGKGYEPHGLGLDVGDSRQRRKRGTRGTKRGPVGHGKKPEQRRDRQQRRPAIGAVATSSRDPGPSRGSDWRQGA